MYDDFTEYFWLGFDVFVLLLLVDLLLRLAFSSSIMSMLFSQFTLNLLMTPFMMIWHVLTFTWSMTPSMLWFLWNAAFIIVPLMIAAALIAQLIYFFKKP